MAIPVAPMALSADDDDNGGQFTTHHVVDTHVRGKALSVVYTNDPVSLESSIQTMEQFLAEDKYQVVGFNVEYTIGRVGHDQKVVIAQLCVRHDVLVYHYHLATRPCERFSSFINSSDYKNTAVDTTNDLKTLKVSGLKCLNLVNIQDHYKVWGSAKNKLNSLGDLASAIIDPYYMKMKDESNKDKDTWHRVWHERLDEEHVKYTTNDTYTSYKMYRWIVDMRKCLVHD
ncbi:hypothetical protein CFC21_041726 [Triticum aestivum]|uniref:3'-5' exonuclease domain-containing protein n=2 Tax=Triticum aestivum TaxID=4565 RepID=A0A3B6FMR2_WHEAT|nr:hypothetical protein CFC21_041726 [Triticum aestivum]